MRIGTPHALNVTPSVEPGVTLEFYDNTRNFDCLEIFDYGSNQIVFSMKGEEFPPMRFSLNKSRVYLVKATFLDLHEIQQVVQIEPSIPNLRLTLEDRLGEVSLTSNGIELTFDEAEKVVSQK